MRVGVVVHDGRDGVSEFARSFVGEALEAGLDVVAEGQAGVILGDMGVGEGDPEVVVAIGGDGTMLSAVQAALDHDVPLFGFNLGTIGFLTEAEPEDLGEVVAALADGAYVEVPRMGVTASLNGSMVRGLNDVVVEKIDTLRLVQLDVEVDREEFVTYRADGLIVATPTGSTAYSFSAGGPLVDHSIEALLMTPVASHSLFARTMVLPPGTVIRVRPRRDRPVRVSVDKLPLGEAEEGDVIEVRRNSTPIRFLRFRPQSFARAVTEKFHLE